MALVYPVYIDLPMMTAFLASLEGGVIEEADIEGKSSNVQERAKTGSLGAKVAGILSSIVDIEGKGEFAKKVNDSLESQYKGTVRFPSAALFIRLRDLLLEQDLVKVINEDSKLEDFATGDLVEFEGQASPNPSYQIRRAFGQMLPLVELNQKLVETQTDQAIALLQDVKPNQSVKLGDMEHTFQNANEIKAARENLKASKQNSQNELAGYQTMAQMLNNLFPEDKMDTLLFRAEDFRFICRVYPIFARDERIQDIHDAQWRCIGKVIGKLSESQSHDLLKGSPIGYLAKDQFPAFASSLNNDHLNVEVTEPMISGPALIVATLGIFA